MGHIFENEFFYITENGEVWRKQNQFFEEKKITTVPIDDIEDTVAKLDESFAEFKSKAIAALEELKTNAEQYKLADSVKTIIKDASDYVGVGDFESVLNPFIDFLKEKGVDLNAPETAADTTSDTDSAEGNEDVDEAFDSEDKDDATSAESEQIEQADSNESDESSTTEVIADESEEVSEEESPVVSVTVEVTEEKEASESDDTDEEDQADESDESTQDDSSDDESDEEEDHDFDDSESIRFYKKLIDRAEDALELADLSLASHQLDDIRFKWADGPDIEDEDAEKYREIQRRLEDIQSEIQQKKTEHFDELTKRRNDNLERKKQLIERFQTIVEKKRWSAINDVRYIQHRWEEIKSIPHEWVERLETQYQGLLKQFEDSRVEFLVAQKQKEEDNLVLKLAVLDKIAALNKSIDPKDAHWDALDTQIEALAAQWKKMGRVAREKEQEVWDSFHTEIHKYEDLKYKHNPAFKKKLDKNVARRTALCEKAESLLEREDLAEAARLINVYHKEWKDNGPVPYEVSDTLWNRFKTASDAFNKKKNENIEVVREQEQANYDAKVAIIEEAKALVDPSDFVKSTKEVEALHEKWKNIGPVPRRKSKKVWKDFKKVLDDFYKGKREFFRSQRQEQKDNLKAKRDIIDKINALIDHESAEEAINEIKVLQKEYNAIGFVPIKYKNKLWKQYRDACDKIYQRGRAEKKSSGSGYQGKGGNHGGGNRPDQELQKLKKEAERLRQEILHYGDTMTFIKPNKQGLKLREEIHKKIEASKEVLANKEAAIVDYENEQKNENAE